VSISCVGLFLSPSSVGMSNIFAGDQVFVVIEIVLAGLEAEETRQPARWCEQITLEAACFPSWAAWIAKVIVRELVSSNSELIIAMRTFSLLLATANASGYQIRYAV